MNEYYRICCILARIVDVEPPEDAKSAKAWFKELKASGVLDSKKENLK